MPIVNKIVLALDPSTANVGWCVGQGDRYIASGCFSPDQRRCARHRIYEAVDWFVEVVRQHDPDVLAIEEPAGDHDNRYTDRLLAGLGYALEAVAHLEIGLRPEDIIRVWPATVKQTGCHKGNVGQTIAAAEAGKVSVGPDEADAIGTWRAAHGILYEEALEALAEAQANQRAKVR